jgi:hypothetical protein
METDNAAKIQKNTKSSDIMSCNCTKRNEEVIKSLQAQVYIVGFEKPSDHNVSADANQ